MLWLVRAGHQYLHTSGSAVLCGNQLSLRQLASSRQPDIDQVTCRVYIHQLIAVAQGQMVTCFTAQMLCGPTAMTLLVGISWCALECNLLLK